MIQRTIKSLEYDKIIEMLRNRTETSLGKKEIENVKIETDIEKINLMQDETEEAYQIIVKRGKAPFGGITDIERDFLLSKKEGVLSSKSVFKVGEGLRGFRILKNFLSRNNEKDLFFTLLKNRSEGLLTDKELETEIEQAIIGEEEISDNASVELRNIRRHIKNQNEKMRNKLNSIINSSQYQKYLQDNVITMREGRYVVPVKQEHRSSFKGIIHDQSSSGATLFIEPLEIVNLNNDIRELELKERDEIERILKIFSEKISIISDMGIESLKIIGQLDMIFARGKLSVDMRGSRPIINNNKYINIKNGRHPLLKKESVVPLNFFIGKDSNTVIITGPNTGGKTVTLKTVGLFVLMSQSGLQIPADSQSEISIFEKIFTDIGDEQSIEQSLSTFSSHMTNIVKIMNSVNENSLVLFDEIGSGTDPVEGSAIAISILEYLKERNIRTIATTHYSELKLFALNTEKVVNASVEFDIDTLVPTYKLLIGVPGKSNAFEISKRLGLDEFLINRARNIVSKENVELEDILSKLEKNRIETERSRVESEELKKELEFLRKSLKTEKEDLESKRQNFLNEARREAKKIVQAAKRESDEIVENIQGIWTDVDKEYKEKIEENRKKLKTKIDIIDENISEKILQKTNREPLKSVDLGDEVKISSLNQIGIVVSKPDNDNNVQVQVGIMKLTVPLNTLEKTKIVQIKESNKYAQSMLSYKMDSVKSEIDLRGKNIEEAIIEIDKYLDDAYLTGHKKVTIIHGKGTGVLRQGVTEILKKHRHVKTQRLGTYNEGGTGVTIVEMK